MENITGVPDKNNMGDFNAHITPEQWHPGTQVDLLTVPWDAQYRNIVDFEDQAALDRYLDNRQVGWLSIDHLTHVRPNEPFRVNIPYNNVVQANYVRVNNPAQPSLYETTNGKWWGDPQRTMYYFILDARYIAANTTQLVLQLDVWQTYGMHTETGMCYVERGHVGIANTDRFRDYGARYLTVPEGLDIGNEYNIVHTARRKIADTNNMGIIVWSTVRLDTDGGNVDNPVLQTATGSGIGDLPNGAAAYYFATAQAFRDWLDSKKEKPWQTQGIFMVQAIPPLNEYGWGVDVDKPLSQPTGKPQDKTTEALRNFRDVARSKLPPEYRHLDKFLTFPYMTLELTANTGNPVVLKPEQWQSAHAHVTEIPHFALPSPRLVFSPRFYNRAENANHFGNSLHDGGEFLDITTGIYDFPVFSVVNNSYVGFLASNRNAIQHQHATADWSQSKALRSADTAYGQATMGIQAGNQHTANQLATNAATLANQNTHGTGRAIASAGQSIGMGAMGGPMGLLGGLTSAVSGGVNEAMAQSERNAQHAITSGSIRRSSEIQTNLQTSIRDSNLELSEFAAKGDYANQVAGINARVQDAKLTQPTTSGQVGGEAFNLTVDQWGYDLKIKMLNPGAMRIIGDFWLRYGYAVNAEMHPNTLSVMSDFTYWKFQEYTLMSWGIPEQYRNAIRGIFEKGVTVWNNPDKIGMVSARDNTPIYGNYYA